MICASYFDGRSAAPHAVLLHRAGATLHLAGPTLALDYPVAGATLAEPLAGAPALLYFADGAHCEIEGRASAAWLAAALDYRKPLAVRMQERWRAAVFGLFLLAALLGAALRFGAPAAADAVVAALPASVDADLGRAMLAALDEEAMHPSRLPPECIAQVQRILDGAVPAHPRMPLRLAVRAAPAIGPNAFALPDGTIIVTDQMILRILGGRTGFDHYRAQQLAGVLGHEIGHLEKRHTVRRLALSSLTAAGSAALFGDLSAVAAAASAELADMQYSREMETEADDYAIATLRRLGMSTLPMAELFDGFRREEERDNGNLAEWLSSVAGYASAHPSDAERIARLRGAQGIGAPAPASAERTVAPIKQR